MRHAIQLAISILLQRFSLRFQYCCSDFNVVAAILLAISILLQRLQYCCSDLACDFNIVAAISMLQLVSHDFIQRRDKTKVCLNEFLNGTSNLKIYSSYSTFNFGQSYKVDFLMLKIECTECIRKLVNFGTGMIETFGFIMVS